jgi:hypothetical protein
VALKGKEERRKRKEGKINTNEQKYSNVPN